MTDTVDCPSRQDAYKMFDRIAHRYDLLNRLLSMGTDRSWRKRMATFLPEKPELKLLDLATGTADVMLFLEGRCPQLGSAVGLDMSGGMLGYGQQKIARRSLSEKLTLVRGDATSLAVASAQFDAVTISFGIRNVLDVNQALREMHRILRQEGRVLILEFSLPGNPLIRLPYLFYFRHILPLVGGLLSGDGSAYRYLNKTVETFPYGEAFADLMRNAGFENVRAIPLSFGIATLYVGNKN